MKSAQTPTPTLNESVTITLTREEHDLLIVFLPTYPRSSLRFKPVASNLLNKLKFLKSNIGDAYRSPASSAGVVGQGGN